MKIKVKKLFEDAEALQKIFNSDAGINLQAMDIISLWDGKEDLWKFREDLRDLWKTKGHLEVRPKQRVLINTGYQFGGFANVPEGMIPELQIRPRSGVTIKTGLVTQLGTIDQNYRGILGVMVVNTSAVIQTIDRGDHIAQFVPNLIPETEVVNIDKIETTDRGEGGFGSTGK